MKGEITYNIQMTRVTYTLTVEPLIKDTLNKGHLCVKDTFLLYQIISWQYIFEDNLSIMDKMICPNVSIT